MREDSVLEKYRNICVEIKKKLKKKTLIINCYYQFGGMLIIISRVWN